MKQLFLFLAIFSCLHLYAEDSTRITPGLSIKKNDTSLHVTFLKTDDLKHGKELRRNWRFKAGDDIQYTKTDFNDTNWQLADSYLLTDFKDQDKGLSFPGIGWFRLHFNIDSASIAKGAIGISMKQTAASEIYLDGKKLQTNGTINGKDSTEMINPTNVPFTLFGLTQGTHVLAVRYANYELYKAEEYDENAGFQMNIGYMNDLTENVVSETVSLSVSLLSLFGIFIALSFIHLFLFLFYRAEKTNLYFSIFTFSVTLLIYCGYFTYIDSDVNRIHAYQELTMITFAAMAFSLSGFSNQLFSKKKLRFYIIAGFSALCLLLWLFIRNLSYTCYIVLFVVVLLEIVFLSIRGIRKKVPGAKIIGIGISFFALFILTSIVLLAFGNLSFEFDELNGQIYLVLGVLSILAIPGSISVYLAWSFSHTSKNLAVQLKQVSTLSEKTLQQELEKQRLLENRQEELEKEVELRTSEIKKEKQKSDDLLRNILPEEIAEELKQTGSSEAKYFDHVSVLFTDFVNFTKAGERMTPQELVNELHTCFKAFDNICSKYNIEKIKTIGDAYLAVCGLPVADPNHAINTTKAAIEIREFIAARTQQLPDKTFHIRIGIHSGSVVAGIVGVKKFAYDIWGDTVNTAARMEQHGESGKINISQNTYDLVKDQFNCTFRGQITAKNKGEMDMYFVEGEK